jgi:hypothetical protein
MTMTHAVFVAAIDDIELAVVCIVDMNAVPADVDIVVVAQTIGDVMTLKTAQYSVDCTCSLINI